MDASPPNPPLDSGAAEAAQTKQAVLRTLRMLGLPAAPVTGDLVKMLARNGAKLDQGDVITALQRIEPDALQRFRR